MAGRPRNIGGEGGTMEGGAPVKKRRRRATRLGGKAGGTPTDLLGGARGRQGIGGPEWLHRDTVNYFMSQQAHQRGRTTGVRTQTRGRGRPKASTPTTS